MITLTLKNGSEQSFVISFVFELYHVIVTLDDGTTLRIAISDIASITLDNI